MRVGTGVGLLISMLAALCPAAAHADEGMWLFSNPPTGIIKEKFGIGLSPQWLEHVQKSAGRVSTGGSASFVSADGLVMTNHHVGMPALADLSTPEIDLLETGFYAKTRELELKCPNLEMNVLWEVEDVTEQVKSAAPPGMPPADAHAERRETISVLESEYEKATGLDCQVVTLYGGERYHLYQYKRFTDLRLAMAPEKSIAFFGGDNDNFEYPRYALDVCFFRVYENGEPYHPQHYLSWSKTGAAEGDLVFVAGHPGHTQRHATAAHLAFMRDVEMPVRMRDFWRREVQLQTFSARDYEFARIADGHLTGIQNARKAYTAISAGLQDPLLMNRVAENEKRIRAAVEANPEYKTHWGGAWDDIAAARNHYREFFLRHRAGIHSTLFGIATHLVRLAEELPKPSAERLPEYTDANLDALYSGLYSQSPIYDDLEIDQIACDLSNMVETFSGDDPFVKRALGDLSPRARAESLVLGCTLMDVSVRKALAEGGAKAIAASDDPMIRFAADLDPDFRAWRKKCEDEVEAIERDAYARIASARFAIDGERVYPGATFTLRLAFGTVTGYSEGGSLVSPFTTFQGLYERAEARRGQKDYALPERWLKRKSRLDLHTPLNFVCTADIAGGNSGSPVINEDAEVVGLIFDVNAPCLAHYIAYADDDGRAVAVDVRAIVEALGRVYRAKPLVAELLAR
ncbi:MAG: S46 family peptidase [Candidatus Hydrogenedentes bacterium]|nr:S46 family peptidase [Candidatus Hydrogenedentota bacterium]